MTLTVLLIVMTGLVLTGFLALLAGLGLGVHACAITGVNFRRLLMVTAVIWVAGLLAGLTAGAALALDRPVGLTAALIVLGLFAMGTTGWVRRCFRTDARKARGAVAMMFAAASLIEVFVGLGLRAAVLETFVVPTGAMAPTILGRHHDVSCSACNWAYSVTVADSNPAGMQMRRSLSGSATSCPNCGATITLPAGTPIANGDRIIADKTTAPRRWEIVVFENPEDRRVNYVKRLVGLPKETMAIHAGDVFADGRRLVKPSSVVRHADANLSSLARARLTFSRMSQARAVQINGLGSELWPAT